jgi:hypothetical protein
MERISIEFTVQDKTLKGFLNAVSGSGVGMYHLIIDGYYYGRVRKYNDSWVFDGNSRSQHIKTAIESLCSDIAGLT